MQDRKITVVRGKKRKAIDNILTDVNIFIGQVGLKIYRNNLAHIDTYVQSIDLKVRGIYMGLVSFPHASMERGEG